MSHKPYLTGLDLVLPGQRFLPHECSTSLFLKVIFSIFSPSLYLLFECNKDMYWKGQVLRWENSQSLIFGVPLIGGRISEVKCCDFIHKYCNDVRIHPQVTSGLDSKKVYWSPGVEILTWNRDHIDEHFHTISRPPAIPGTYFILCYVIM